MTASGLRADDVPAVIRQAVPRLRLVVFDFDGVFTDNAVWVDEDGRESVRCTRADGIGLDKLRTRGIALQVLSTEKNKVVAARCKKLKLPCIHGCDDKGARLAELLAEHGLTPAEMAYFGNDENDRACLELAGLPMVTADAHPSVVPLARWQSSRPGGHGAVREFCDLVAACL